jgi:UDP-glucuronate 4-epimerase
MNIKTILVTGCAGFIGCETTIRLIEQGYKVIGIDNLNDYYSVKLKENRLSRLSSPNFQFFKYDLVDKASLLSLFKEHRFELVIQLAAQAGVRYSLENPQAYIDSNVTGFLNILECCRLYPPQHLVYASSSSVYGRNTETPFRTTDRTEKPSSLYAATKKSNELMAETYCHLFGINSTGLRFFTVYGPWGRPDMAPWLFADAISQGKPLKVFNNGKMMRDFTFIADIVNGILNVAEAGLSRSISEHRLYNIGRGKPINLLDFIKCIETSFGRSVEKQFLPMQPGDVEVTWADTEALEKEVGYSPSVDLADGVAQFIKWFKSYNHLSQQR